MEHFFSLCLPFNCILLDRILELGFGKEVKEIIDLLGSRKCGSSKIDAASVVFKSQRQNLLLSATLNEKVNHLAKISLDNPVMVGLGDKKMQPISSPEHSGSDSDDMEQQLKITGPSTVDYRIPVQLTQRYVKGLC